MLVVVGLTAVRPSGGTLGKGFGMLGSASYSIYLTHLTFIGIVYKASEITGVFGKVPVPLMYLVLSVSGIVGAIVISRLVEYPLMRGVRARFFERPLAVDA
jgi:peptidoglycan/LPS O-acetylase OafA/YrhL